MPDSVTNRTPAVTPPSEERDASSLGVSQAHRSPRDEDFPRPFGRYELRALLGRGGMGAVYLAHDPQLDRLVALKIPRLFDDDSLAWRERFQAEARAAANLHHPNICPVYEVGEADSRPYLTMAYIEGETLAARLRRTGPPPIPDAIALVRTVARAMAEAHDRGIVHRDLKPANVIIDRRGQPVVMDFGLALRTAATGDERLTRSGVAMGTPSYMPPEQAGGDHDVIGPPADVYALGVVLYEVLTGQLPFRGTTIAKLLAQIERDQPPSPSALNPGIDPALEAIILKTLEKLPEKRFATAGILADALDGYSECLSDVVVKRQNEAERADQLTDPYIPADASAPPFSVAKTATRRSRRVAAGVFGVCLLASVVGVMYLTRNTTAPSSAEALAKLYQRAVQNKDEAAIRRLCYSIETAEDGTLDREFLGFLLASHSDLIRVSVGTVDAAEAKRRSIKTNEKGTYRLRPYPSARLNMEYVVGSRPGSGRPTSVLIGEEGGVYYISTYQRDK